MHNISHNILGHIEPLLDFKSNDGQVLILCQTTNGKASHYLSEVTKTSKFIVLYGNETEDVKSYGFTSLKEFKITKGKESAFRHVINAQKRATEVFLKNYVNNLDKVNFSKI